MAPFAIFPPTLLLSSTATQHRTLHMSSIEHNNLAKKAKLRKGVIEDNMRHGIRQYYKSSQYKLFMQSIQEEADISVIKKMIDEGASARWFHPDDTHPASLAIMRDDFPLLVLLVDNGTNVNYFDSANNTLLCQAVIHQRNHMIKFLISRGADVNYQIPNYIRLNAVVPLAATPCFFNDKTLRLLLENGADVNARGPDEMTALMVWATDHTEYPLSIAETLFEFGADPTLEDCGGRNMFFYAMSYFDILEGARFSTIMGYLMRAGVKTDTVDKFGKTPMQYCLDIFECSGPVQKSHDEIVEYEEKVRSKIKKEYGVLLV